MPIEVFELLDSRRSAEGDSPSHERRYLVQGTDDDAAARAAVAAAAPVLVDGLKLQDLAVEPVGWRTWTAACKYSPRKRFETGDARFRFSTAGGTTKITQARSTRGNYARAGETAPDFKGAIGVTDDGVEGVDILLPGFAFEVTRYVDAAAMAPDYVAKLYRFSGCVNQVSVSLTIDGIFLQFAAGELLFRYADGGKRRVEKDWEITYYFEASKNASGLSVGDISGVAKRGHDYLWTRYEKVVDTSAEPERIVQVPASVHVEQVYEFADLRELEL